MPFRRSRVRMIRLSSHWLVPAGRQSKNSLLRTCCSSKPATPLFHAGQHADRRLYRWPLPVSADLRRRSRLPEARVAQLVEQRIENPRVGGSNPPPGTIARKFTVCFQCIASDCNPRPNRAWITFADPGLRLLNPVCLMLSSAALRKPGMRLSEAAGLAKEKAPKEKAPSEGAYH